MRAERHAAAAAEEVEVRASVDRTALWPGDRVRYTVEAVCAPGIDVVADDLAGERLVLSGLEFLASEHERHLGEDGRTSYRVRHELAAYALSAPLRIGEQAVRYFARRPGQRGEEAAPAGEVRIPAVSLALRSTLPDDLGEARLRDGAPSPPLPVFASWARPLGLALILLCGLPAAAAAASALRRRGRERGARRARVTSGDLRPELAELRKVDATSPEARRRAYDRLDVLLRRRLGELAGADVRALTGAEIAARLGSPADGLPPSLAAVLDECERARYGPPEALPAADRFQAGVSTAAAMLEGRRWS
jgi:hypothetical protein